MANGLGIVRESGGDLVVEMAGGQSLAASRYACPLTGNTPRQ
jgi:hypothetical protein